MGGGGFVVVEDDWGAVCVVERGAWEEIEADWGGASIFMAFDSWMGCWLCWKGQLSSRCLEGLENGTHVEGLCMA